MKNQQFQNVNKMRVKQFFILKINHIEDQISINI